MFRLLMQSFSGQLKIEKYLDVRAIWDPIMFKCVVQVR